MKNTLTALILLIAISTSAQQSFSLEEAIDFALENNRTAINASRDIDAAKKQKWETTASGLPQISAAIDYQNYLKQPVSLIPAEFFGGEPGEFAEVTFGTKQNVNAVATLNQLIFDGSYLVGLQSAKVFLEISKNAKVKTDLEVRKQVINAYGNVLLAEASIDILEKNKATLEKNVFEVQKTYENGLAEEESVEQLKITLAGVESSLSNNKRLRDIAYKMLNMALGLDINVQLELTDDLNSLTAKNIIIGLVDTPFLLENNIDYKIAKNDERSKQLLMKYEKTKALPTINAFLNGGYQSFADDDFPFLDKDQEWFGSSIFGVSVNIPIFSSLARSARTQRAKIEFEKAKTQLTDTEQRIKLELQNAQSNYQYVVEQYETAKQNLELAERIEQKNQVKFSEGIASSFDLRQAQTQLYTSQQEYLQAMVNVINQKAELETILNSEQLINQEQD
ncbi:TolC family protein [Abyssalbus ytuae]|uniref:TolC family protein n=1 Tax=Abyssalbus ytuae TaxID=2926907 RepID=A0A9E6ZK29_9FLAO|nr:TolC family protein [Abyssalbus ytuae]UOB15979.1 TolC family protein [Abyssalbus ytuae]